MVGTRSVLVLEADDRTRSTYASWIADEYHVLLASTPEETRTRLNRAVDVVLASEELAATLSLQEIRSRTDGCHVVAVTPLSDTAGTSLDGVDESLARPVTRTELVETVTTYLEKAAYDRKLRSFYSLAAMKAELETELDPDRLAESTSYQRVCRRVQELRADLGDTVDRVDTDWACLFQVCQEPAETDDRQPVA